MKFKDLSADYQGRTVFQGVTGELKLHKITMLLGQNGAGKSTLMAILSGLKSGQGEYTLSESTFYLPQKNQVFDYLQVKTLLQMSSNTPEAVTDEIITSLDLLELMERDFLNLSSGQQQRVWLAYALLQAKDVTLLDEPLTFLDLKYQQRLLKLLVDLKQTAARTFLLSIHDPRLARQYGDVVWLLDKNGLTTGQPVQLLTAPKIRDFFELD